MNNNNEPKTRRPEDTPFKQQKLKAWQPILTPNWVIGTFTIIACIFIPLGIVLYEFSNGVIEYSIQYDGYGIDPTLNTEEIVPYNTTSGGIAPCYLANSNESNQFNLNKHGCLISFKIRENMKAPIYVYYQLDRFYQNHRRFVQSRSDGQLRGMEDASIADCEPLTEDTLPKYDSTDGLLHGVNTWKLNPCGLIANSLFNDIFWINSYTAPNGKTFYQMDAFPHSIADKNKDEAKTNVYEILNQEGIAWETDVKTKFKNPTTLKDDNLYLWQNPKYRYIIPREKGQLHQLNVTAWTKPSVQYGVQDEHFIVWMRTAGLPHFRKLYGKINVDLEKGSTLQFLVSSNFLVSTFDGKKSLVISTVSWFGGKNPFLGLAYITVGGLCLILAILFFLKHKFSPRKLGDTRYLVWKNNQ